MQMSTGNRFLKRRVAKPSPLSLMTGFIALFLSLAVSVQAQNVTAKVYRQGSSGNAYGKLHLPKGQKYKVAMYPSDGVMVGVFRARVDGQNIYLTSVDPYGQTYWIDASEVEQNFVVRSSDGSDVVATPVTAAEEQRMDDEGWFFFDASEARRNGLKYAAAKISSETLRTQTATKDRPVYVMANPAKYGLAFAWLNQANSTKDLPAGSLYLVGKAGSRARLMNIVFENDVTDETTAINNDQVSVAAPATDDACYTLQGLRIAEPQPGTLYIKNGRKFVAK